MKPLWPLPSKMGGGILKDYQIVAINLGSTSTKIAYYRNDQRVFQENLDHDSGELGAFTTIWDQEAYRLEAIRAFLRRHALEVSDLDAVVTRGGHTRPIPGGVYRVNGEMLRQSGSGAYGQHPTDLGLRLVWQFDKEGPIPLTVDPPTTDEFDPLARYSGHPLFPRKSAFHALNHRAVSRQYAADLGRPYESLNLISVHMGGGITVAAHRKGQMVDANNGLMGDGPFSTNRTGSVPVGALMELCFSGAYTKQDVKQILGSKGGLLAYLGTSDMRRAEAMADADPKAMEVLMAMCYQIAKEIGGLGAVLCGQMDAILLTGGIAHSELITGEIKRRVGYLAPVVRYPGEYEMQSLALGAYDVLRGTRQALELQPDAE